MPLLDNLLAQAYETLQQQTAIHAKTWGFGSETSWSLDQEVGILYWEFAGAKLVQAPVQIIGTLHQGIFQWAWANSSINDALSEHAQIVKEYGEQHDIALLTQPKLPADEHQAWHYAALARQLVDANGVYRGYVEDAELYIYMIFGEVNISIDHASESVAEFYERCLDVTKEKAKTHKALWELGREKDCKLDLEAGTLTLTLADKLVQTPLQIIGTLNGDRFTWAWADGQIPKALTRHAQYVKSYGQNKAVPELSTAIVQASQDDAWQYAALASSLAEVDGVYVAQVENKHIYVTLSELNITLTKTPIDDAAEVFNFLQEYMQARFEVDKQYRDREALADTHDPKLLKDSVDKAQAIYHQYWCTKTKSSLPMSVAWPSNFDLTVCHSWQCRKVRGGFKVIYAYRRGSGLRYNDVDDRINVYKLKRFEDGYKITDYIALMSTLRCGINTSSPH